VARTTEQSNTVQKAIQETVIKLDSMKEEKSKIAARVQQQGRKPTEAERQRMRGILRRIALYTRMLEKANQRLVSVEERQEKVSTLLQFKEDAETMTEMARDMRKLGLNPDKVEQALEKAQENLDDADEFGDTVDSMLYGTTAVGDMDSEIDAAFEDTAGFNQSNGSRIWNRGLRTENRSSSSNRVSDSVVDDLERMVHDDEYSSDLEEKTYDMTAGRRTVAPDDTELTLFSS